MASVTHLTNQSQFVQSNAAFAGTNATGTIASNGISVSVAAPVAQTAFVFSNSNGVSFGTNGSTVTATVATNYQSQGAYLTTAALSNHSHNFATTTTNGSLIVVATTNSVGATIAVPSYLTTAAQSDHSHGNPTLNLTNLSGTTASNSAGFTLSLSAAAGGGGADGYNILAAGTQTANTTGTVLFNNGNGITFGMSNSSVITASHNGLTTARASNDAVGLNTALTAGPLAWTVNSNGISLNAGSAAGTTSGFGGNLISGSMTHNTAGLNLSLNHPAWLTTAMQSNAATISNVNISAGTTSTNASAFTFSNANGVSFGLGTGASAGRVTASHDGLTSQSNQNITAANGGFAFQTLSFSNVNGISFGTSAGSAITASHNALTTARASNDAIGLNTAQTNVTWTVNSSGLSLNAAGYAGTGTTFNGANVSGSMTVNSNGVQLSLSAGAGGGVTPVASASNGSFSFTTLNFSNANNVTFGTSAGNIITASVAAPGAAAENNWMHALGNNTAGNTTASGSTVGLSGINLTISGTNNSVFNLSVPATSSLSATGQVSISTNGSTISIGVPVAQTYNGFNPYADIEKQAGQYGQATLQFDPVRVPNVQFDRVVIPVINTNSSNSSGSHTLSFWLGLYSKNASTLSLVQSVSSSTALTHSGTAGSYSLYSGQRLFTIPMTTTLTEGDYWIGFVSRTTSGGANGSYSNLIASNIASNFLGFFGSSHNTTYQLTLGQGVYTATTSGIPSSVGFSQIRGSDSQARRAAFIMFASSTI